MRTRFLVFAFLLAAAQSLTTAAEEGLGPLFPANGPPNGWLVREWNDLAKAVPDEVQWNEPVMIRNAKIKEL